MKRHLPFAIILGALVLTFAGGALFFYLRHAPSATTAAGKPGAEPAHVRGPKSAPATLEEFGDFECIPCFLLWPALRNLEHDFGNRLSVIFREHPMAQHPHAVEGARAAEAAGLQGHFWEMHDALYIDRG